jgi:hypothetical protein
VRALLDHGPHLVDHRWISQSGWCPNPTGESPLTRTAKPLVRYGAVEGALASGFATVELHHQVGHDLTDDRVAQERRLARLVFLHTLTNPQILPKTFGVDGSGDQERDVAHLAGPGPLHRNAIGGCPPWGDVVDTLQLLPQSSSTFPILAIQCSPQNLIFAPGEFARA